MKKTIYILFLMFFLISVPKKVDAQTKKLDDVTMTENGETECRYAYTDDNGNYKEFNIVYDSESISSNISNFDGMTDSFSEEWRKAVKQLPWGCLRSIWVREYTTTTTEGHYQNQTTVIHYHTQLGFEMMRGGEGGVNYLATCTNCPESGFGDIFNSSEFDCESLIGEEMIAFINKGMNIIKLIVPIIVIGLGVIDIAKAIFASNDDEIKKAQKTFFKRLIIAVIIFFSPILVNFIIDITNEAAGFFNSGTCGVK